jgi:hypothetical protein
VTDREITTKLPDGQYTQTGKETLKKLFRVHFPDSKLTDDSNNGQGQQNLEVCKHKMNREDHACNDQSKIKWALGPFKPFNSAETDGIVLALLQHRVEHLIPHI